MEQHDGQLGAGGGYKSPPGLSALEACSAGRDRATASIDQENNRVLCGAGPGQSARRPDPLPEDKHPSADAYPSGKQDQREKPRYKAVAKPPDKEPSRLRQTVSLPLSG